ncbi:hypothetical protein IWX76_003203 [Pedobacter sp. CAN_A7]|uniref:hypothetical protein n=1 Tax=Pedobacter sp. CAN_A7 TaxID=2787722 RepID=UPI0018CB2C4C
MYNQLALLAKYIHLGMMESKYSMVSQELKMFLNKIVTQIKQAKLSLMLTSFIQFPQKTFPQLLVFFLYSKGANFNYNKSVIISFNKIYA